MALEARTFLRWCGLHYLATVLRYTHPAGRSGFATPELARRFRAAAFAKHGISSSLESGPVPRTITVLSNVYGEKVRSGSLQDNCPAPGYDSRLRTS